MPNACVIEFPGSNCFSEMFNAFQIRGFKTTKIFYKDLTLTNKNFDIIAIPGGFSYGDYLRSGAMAARSKIMSFVKTHADRGGLVLGVCNGFQVLTEAGLLKGALLRNSGGDFICKDLYIKSVSSSKVFTAKCTPILKAQIAHADGRFFSSPDELKQLQDTDMIAFKYCNSYGEVSQNDTPNGSLDCIAGIFGGKNKNILGMMPHPERPVHNGNGGQIFDSILSYLS